MTTSRTEAPRLRLGHGGGGRLTGEAASDTRGTVLRLLQYLKPYTRALTVVGVLAVIAKGNERSERLFKKLGFTHEGTLRHATRVDGQFTDLLCTSMLEDEYNGMVGVWEANKVE